MVMLHLLLFASEDTVYQFTAAQLLEGVIDPDIEYEVKWSYNR